VCGEGSHKRKHAKVHLGFVRRTRPVYIGSHFSLLWSVWREVLQLGLGKKEATRESDRKELK